MLLLIIYVSIALGFSFYCSVAEAVLLSVNHPYITLLEKEGKRSGALLKSFKSDVNRPLAAILTLNTIAHTMGAAGAGAQAAAVFGNQYLGIASAVLTLLILIFSEIIPKTIGATYWRQLAPMVAFSVRGLIWILYPFVWLSEMLKEDESLKSQLVFGVTAYGATKNLDNFKAFLDFIHGMGCRVILKRFEADLIPLDQLKDYKLDYIRLARSYTQGVSVHEQKRNMVISMAELGNLIDVKVLAEAVEDDDDYQCILQTGLYGASR